MNLTEGSRGLVNYRVRLVTGAQALITEAVSGELARDAEVRAG